MLELRGTCFVSHNAINLGNSLSEGVVVATNLRKKTEGRTVGVQLTGAYMFRGNRPLTTSLKDFKTRPKSA